MKYYNLENRTLDFAKQIREFVKFLPKYISNIEYSKQLVRSSASVGANYREANESLSKKDFLFRIRISKKEAKETSYWLELIEPNKKDLKIQEELLKESIEIMNILGSILRNAK